MIKLDNISFKPDKNNFIFKHINIFIPSGSIINLDGNAKEGKTSFLKLISVIKKPTSGKMFLFGKEVSKLNKQEILYIKRDLGIVFEDNFFIDNMNVQENILFPLIYKKESNKEMLSALNELLPWLSLEEIRKRKLSEVSKVESKLVQFARAIIGRPRILLLDNLFLDIKSDVEKKIVYLILALNKIGTTTIVIGKKPITTQINFDKSFIIKNKNIIEIRGSSDKI